MFRKKTQVEQLIASDGIDHATDRFSEIISRTLPTREIALQFILQELDGASQGNSASQRFAADSGIQPSQYRGALQNSVPEVEGPAGPQQTLLALSLDLVNSPALMADFRCRIADKIMQKFAIGKYAQDDDKIATLLNSLKDLLMGDKDVMPGLTANIQAPVEAPVRHIRFRAQNLNSANELIAALKELTAESTNQLIRRALA